MDKFIRAVNGKDRVRKAMPKMKALPNLKGGAIMGGAGAATPVFTKQVDCMQSVQCSHLCTPMCQ